MIVNARSVENWIKPMYDPVPGRGMNRLIWDAVDKQRISVYYQIAFGDAAAHYFPGTLVANDKPLSEKPAIREQLNGLEQWLLGWAFSRAWIKRHWCTGTTATSRPCGPATGPT